MTRTIDDILADAAIPTTSPTTFDIGAALRRLAADAPQAASPPPDMDRSAKARERLATVSRWILNGPGSALHVDRLAEGPEQSARLLEEDALDVEGALVYACLLYLTGHHESAQFWWQLAAGADSRAAAYCLHLHHTHLGEPREARHWYHQLTDSTTNDSSPPDDAFIEGLEAVARYVRRHGSDATAPTGRLEGEVDRLASRSVGSPCVIVRRPDQRLVDRLYEFFARRT
ncbi:hypothetical protein [Streptomyces sp. NBC_00690]|uniref:hypothetical protein n=1 Tax=Streptomyces sp. NBC_00690 TaxID=2975808 RepID=UPI002E2D6B1D|nr:hypothetical protein [Streptomyces sp. NBC_00690]